MSQWLQWIILTSITGSPLLSALILIVIWFTVDRFTLGILPDPLRWVQRRRRETRLTNLLLGNPHDRQARRELAELLVARGAHAKAVGILRHNLDAGDDDAATVFTMGVACLGAGHTAQGEKLLEHVKELDPDFRVGEVDFGVGRDAVRRKDWAKAKEAFERAVQVRRGSIEGRTLLAKAMAGLGDDAGAALKRDEAWSEYVSAPGFQRRKERRYAWMARPSRPIFYATFALMGLILFARFFGPGLTDWAQEQRGGRGYGGYGYRPYANPPAAPTPEPEEE